METCRYCGSADLVTTPEPAGSTHHARTTCGECGRFLRWERAPMTFERAAAFVMPLGKHKGRTLDDVAATDGGLRYLDWLIAQEWVKGSLRRAVECYLLHPAIAKDLNRIVGDD